jgi:hypothetical protein
MDVEVFNFSEKITCSAFYLVLWTTFSTCPSTCTHFKKRWLDLFCNYHHIQCVCNHSTRLVVIFYGCNLSFCYIFGTSKILALKLYVPIANKFFRPEKKNQLNYDSGILMRLWNVKNVVSVVLSTIIVINRCIKKLLIRLFLMYIQKASHVTVTWLLQTIDKHEC